MDLKLSDYLSEFNKIKKLNYPKENETIKIYILRSFSCEIIEPVISVKLFEMGYNCKICIGGYNQFFQEVLNDNSPLYDFKPDFVIMAVRIEDFYPIIFDNFFEEKENMNNHIQKILSDISSIIYKIKENLNTNILINNFIRPYYALNGMYQNQKVYGINNIIRKLNIELSQIAQNINTGLYIVDNEQIASELGFKNIYDLKMWEISKNPYKINYYSAISDEILKYIYTIKGKRKKCIVLDLDNTLWKGIIAEDGYENIKIYKEFQKQLLFLNKSGIILAVNSKNNEQDGLNVIKNHPDMILREDNFAAIRINWTDKATNIKSISKELNIGLDSMIFIDDSPIECEIVKKTYPEVTVINLAGNSFDYIDILRNTQTDFLNITDEDMKKSKIYKQQTMRNQFQNASVNLEEFLKGLEMTAEISIASDYLIPRISQLTQKTNQFNMTTKRYTEQEIKELIKKGFLIYVLNLKDKFGDNGVTGLIIINTENKNNWIIDTFLLSCRIMNRNAEKALIGFVINQAYEKGINKISGEFIPTKKNIPSKDVYKNMGFYKSDKYWCFDIKNKFKIPEYIKIAENNI